MSELIGFVTSPWSWIAWVLLLFEFVPPTVLRIIVRAYPAEHPRRRELLDEFDHVPYRRRPLWVAAIVPVAVDEGLAARRARRAYCRARHVGHGLVGDRADGASRAARSPLGRVTRALLAVAARRLPRNERARYKEEWEAESNDQPRRIRWVHGLRLIMQARAIGRALRWRPASGIERQRPW